jgi:hypothetical protein
MVPPHGLGIEDRHVNKTSKYKIAVTLGLPHKVGDLLAIAQMIHDTTAANPKSLPSPSPALSVLQTDINALANKEAIAKTRVAGAVIDRDLAARALRIDLNNERAYVELVANADPANAAQIAQDAGMKLRKPLVRNKPPLAVKAGATSGSVKVVAKATKGAHGNDWQLSLDGGKTWVDLPSTTKASTSVANLTPATTVQFRQRVLTKAGKSDWSVPVPHIVV